MDYSIIISAFFSTCANLGGRITITNLDPTRTEPKNIYRAFDMAFQWPCIFSFFSKIHDCSAKNRPVKTSFSLLNQK